MNGTGLRMLMGGLLGWSVMTEKKRLRNLKRSMKDNQRIAPKKYTIKIEMEEA